MISIDDNYTAPQRPDCMVTLDLAPPYTLDDVKRAYLLKARASHPDSGGNPARFRQIQKAFERASEYVCEHGSATEWIGRHLQQHLEHEQLIDELTRRGARIDVQRIDWVGKWVGDDFARLADRIVGLHFHGPTFDDTTIEYLLDRRSALGYLTLLDLAGSQVTGAGLWRLSVLPTLQRLDLRNVSISYHSLKSLLGRSRKIARVNVRGTRIGAWDRLKLHYRFPKVVVTVSGTPSEILLGKTLGPAPTETRPSR